MIPNVNRSSWAATNPGGIDGASDSVRWRSRRGSAYTA